ncbi:MAG TPA: PD-(D/E)XK nuclease family protein [Mycobacteriales bacterium]|jgi:RecB family exonuclease|nr:PD-(D/E)XK nuclease family protein [Mycobacteriales bacterium]
METLTFTGMPRRLFGVSASSLGAWLDCPRRYRFAYVDRPAPPRGRAFAHGSVGASVHNALREWWLAPRERRTPEAAATGVDLAWIPEGFRDAEQSETWRARAREWVSAYVAGVDPADEPRSVERNVAARYRDTQVKGRLDRLDERDGELVVVDYKTGRRGVSGDEARGSWALAIYAYAVERTLRRPCRRVELHHVPTGEVVAHEFTVESLRRQLDRIDAAAEEVRAAVAAVADASPGEAAGAAEAAFPARPSPGCAWCDFHRSCAAGQAAVPRARDPWAGLGGEA